MRRKRQTKKKKSHLPPLLASEDSLITSLLKECGQTDPTEIIAKLTDSRLAKSLVERLPADNESIIPLLLSIHEYFQEKQVRKAVKRIIFKLKRRGIQVDEPYSKKNRVPAILMPTQKDRHEAYVGPIDTMGYRAVIMALHRSMKGVDLGVGLISDENGIQHFLFGNYSKKSAKEVKDSLFEKTGPLIKTSLSHCLTIIESAYQSHLEISLDSPADYLKIRPWLLENVSLLDRPVICDVMSEEWLSNGDLTYSQLDKLFKHNLMESWLIDFENLKPFMEDILKVDDSPIILNDSQKSERIREIEETCMLELFTAPKRDLLKNRLEEMAYVFYKLDEEEYSRLSLTAASTVVGKDNTFEMNPVIQYLLERSLKFYFQMANKDDSDSEKHIQDSSSRIIIP